VWWHGGTPAIGNSGGVHRDVEEEVNYSSAKALEGKRQGKVSTTFIDGEGNSGSSRAQLTPGCLKQKRRRGGRGFIGDDVGEGLEAALARVVPRNDRTCVARQWPAT
jgi:hypothetical protein